MLQHCLTNIDTASGVLTKENLTNSPLSVYFGQNSPLFHSAPKEAGIGNGLFMSAFSPPGASIPQSAGSLPSAPFPLSPPTVALQPWSLTSPGLAMPCTAANAYSPSPYFSSAVALDHTLAAWLQMRSQLVALYYQQQQEQSHQLQMQWSNMKEAMTGEQLVDLSNGNKDKCKEISQQVKNSSKRTSNLPISNKNDEERDTKEEETILPALEENSLLKFPTDQGQAKTEAKLESESVLQVTCDTSEYVNVDDQESALTSSLPSPRSQRSRNASLVSDGFDCKMEQVSPSSSQSPSKRRKSSFQSGITVGYTYDAFFVSDGRSKKKQSKLNSSKTSPAEQPLPKKQTLITTESDDLNATSQSVKTPAILRNPRQRYVCSECGKDYATSSNLSRHKQTHRSFDSQMAKKCPHCEKVYVSMPALSMHILTHDLKHRCTVCGKAFSRPWLLHGHLRAHTGEKPYGCAHCGRAFADRSNLRAHMQTHSSLKQYTCKRCGKSFALKSYLNKHAESACLHQNSNNKSLTSETPPPSSMDVSTCSSSEGDKEFHSPLPDCSTHGVATDFEYEVDNDH